MEKNAQQQQQRAIWGEEWQWPVVGQVADSILSQAEECLTEEKTEEEIRMENYIVENILESEESQHGNSSGSSSDTFYDFRAPNVPSSPISSTTSTQPRMVFSFPPPTTYSVWPTSNCTNNRTTTTYYGSTYNPSRISMRSDQTPTYQEMIRPARHFSLPVSNSQPISTISTMSMSTTTSMYPPIITRSQSSPSSPSLFRNFIPSNLPPPAPSSRVRRNSNRRADECGFCKSNGEIPAIYANHKLTDNQGRVSCPQLRGLVCDICGATGDIAHTWSYCPSNTRAPSVALPTLLKSTPRQSDGRWRKRGSR